MTDIETFMANAPLGKCTALRASITQKQCDLNRKTGNVFSCTGCKGLVDVAVGTNTAAEIKKEETPVSYKGDCKHCGRKNQSLPSPGKCARCYDRMKKGLDVITGLPMAKQAPAPEPTPEEITDKLADFHSGIEIGTLEEIEEEFTKNLVEAASKPMPITLTESDPPVTRDEIHIVNLIEIFKVRQAAELETFLAELGTRTDPMEKLRFVYEVCK